MGSVFRDIPHQAGRELFGEILQRRDFKLERIVSFGQSTAAGTWLDQPAHEWVLLLAGRARLRMGPAQEEIALEPGDHLLIPAHTRHRVEWTDPGQRTVWLALHFRPDSREDRPAAQDGRIPERVEIIRSPRRRKTVSARLQRDVMYVRAPSAMSSRELARIVERFKRSLRRRMLKKDLNRRQDLRAVAERLNRKYFGGRLRLRHIEYVADQFRKFGCCDYRRGEIRISHHVSEMPDWVRDYVIVHELAHLVRPDHSPDFWELVNAYRYAERARGYLLARGYELQP